MENNEQKTTKEQIKTMKRLGYDEEEIEDILASEPEEVDWM